MANGFRIPGLRVPSSGEWAAAHLLLPVDEDGIRLLKGPDVARAVTHHQQLAALQLNSSERKSQERNSSVDRHGRTSNEITVQRAAGFSCALMAVTSWSKAVATAVSNAVGFCAAPPGIPDIPGIKAIPAMPGARLCMPAPGIILAPRMNIDMPPIMGSIPIIEAAPAPWPLLSRAFIRMGFIMPPPV